MIISVEGGPRSGKGLMLTYMAAEAFLSGLQVVSNYPLEFPSKKRTHTPIQADLRRVVEGDLSTLTDAAHFRHEFYTEVESRLGTSSNMRLKSLDWAMQVGKAGSSLAWDTQDYDAIDKRLRVVVVERIWALRPFHRRGEDFVYVVYDRPTLHAELVKASEAAMSLLYAHYDTLARASRAQVGR